MIAVEGKYQASLAGWVLVATLPTVRRGPAGAAAGERAAAGPLG
jgi:hypothetical protein